ncbi:hypothetical protein D3C71_2077430 [compost metagenome]
MPVGRHQVTDIVHVAVLDLQLQLFVVAVDQVVGDALHQVLGIDGCVLEHGFGGANRVSHDAPVR